MTIHAIGEIIEFIRREVEESGASGVVLGLGGGIDSSLTSSPPRTGLFLFERLAVIGFRINNAHGLHS